MLALVLYCNGDCNYNLSQSQRNNILIKTKWPVFDLYSRWAIKILSKHQLHYENIYTGLHVQCVTRYMRNVFE